jgi:hypothetical protein
MVPSTRDEDPHGRRCPCNREDGGGLGRLGVVVDDEHLQVPGMLRRTVSPRFGLLSVGC